MTKVPLLAKASVAAVMLSISAPVAGQGHGCQILRDQMNSGTPAERARARSLYNRRCARPVPPSPAPHRRVPPAARAPSPAAQNAGRFVVHFDYDRAAITPEAAVILDNVAAEWRRMGGTAGLVVAGHTDRVGSYEYNRALSHGMATGVRDYLVAHGVARGSISVEAWGEDGRVVETARGVREPRNRRVVITFARRTAD